MTVSSSVSRLTVYFERNGFRATVRRLALAARRTLFSSRMVLFYCDLPALSSQNSGLSGTPKVERHKNQADLSSRDLEEITSFWNPELANRNLQERFARGASLWLIRWEDKLAGYGWTLQGRTIEPHYFRLGPDDVHLFDFHVFPQYRGRGMNPMLVNSILCSLAVECRGRAFIEAAEWNQPQLASLRKTPFHRLGWARKLTIFGRTMVCWDENKTTQEQKGELKNASADVTGRQGAKIRDLRA